MPIRVFAHHMELTEGIRHHVTERAEHIRRIFDGIITVHVTLDAEKERRSVEVVANVSHGSPVVSRVTTQNVTEAIDLAFHKVEAQLRKHKDKLRDHRGHGAEAPAPEAPPPDELPDASASDLTTE